MQDYAKMYAQEHEVFKRWASKELEGDDMKHKPIACPGCGTTFMPNQWRREQNDATHLGCHLHQAAPALLEALEKALLMMDTMTTRDWERGKDHSVREQARNAIKEAK